jgi:hypothetical protein
MFADSRDFGLSPHLVLDGYSEMWVSACSSSLCTSAGTGKPFSRRSWFATLPVAPVARWPGGAADEGGLEVISAAP